MKDKQQFPYVLETECQQLAWIIKIKWRRQMQTQICFRQIILQVRISISAASMGWWNGSPLVQVMTRGLFDARSFPEPMLLAGCQLRQDKR